MTIVSQCTAQSVLISSRRCATGAAVIDRLDDRDLLEERVARCFRLSFAARTTCNGQSPHATLAFDECALEMTGHLEEANGQHDRAHRTKRQA